MTGTDQVTLVDTTCNESQGFQSHEKPEHAPSIRLISAEVSDRVSVNVQTLELTAGGNVLGQGAVLKLDGSEIKKFRKVTLHGEAGKPWRAEIEVFVFSNNTEG
jgi:hypothetical protein